MRDEIYFLFLTSCVFHVSSFLGGIFAENKIIFRVLCIKKKKKIPDLFSEQC